LKHYISIYIIFFNYTILNTFVGFMCANLGQSFSENILCVLIAKVNSTPNILDSGIYSYKNRGGI
jgi:hypothetical protein